MPHAAKAEATARKLNFPLVRLEDGFLCSVEPGAEYPPLSLVWDDLGVYYDASQPSRLDMLLGQLLSLERFPDHNIILKTHPDVVAGRKKGYFSESIEPQSERVAWIAEDVHAPALIEHASAVFCVTSQIGFEALLWGKPVHVFGMPFYAGRGLTEDALPAPAFRQPLELEALVYASLVQYPRYLDPETREQCEPERVLDWLALQ